MGAEQPEEAADVVQELENVDVLAMFGVNQVRVSACHCCKDEGHHDEGEDCQSSSAKPAIVDHIGSRVVPNQLHDQGTG